MAKKPRKEKPFRVNPLVIIITILLLICGGYMAAHFFLPNFTEESPYAYFPQLDPDLLTIVVHNDLPQLEERPVERDGEIYLPVGFVRETIDPSIFWDPSTGRLTITTGEQVVRIRAEQLDYQINHASLLLDRPVLDLDGTAYLPVGLIEAYYPFEIQTLDEWKIVTIDDTTQGRTIRTTTQKTDLRFEPNKKSPIQARLEEGVELIVYDMPEADPGSKPDRERESYAMVRTPDGLVGYVLVKQLGEERVIDPVIPEEKNVTPEKHISDPFVLLWDQMFSVEANSAESRLTFLSAVDVLSPTWFTFDETTLNGDIVSVADIEYVRRAHDNGQQVWALINDFASGSENIFHAVLGDTESREAVIDKLLALIRQYELDGLNIDFEYVPYTDGPLYLQFLRELKPFMLELGAVLSVDMYVPSPWTSYYNRTEVAKTVDYICVMTYDEHTKGSPNAGPVASLPFVEQGITDTLLEAPKEKVLMGIPFYVRVWRVVTKNGETSHTIENYSMDTAYAIFERNNAEFIWLPDTGAFYAEYSAIEDGEEVTYKVWLEDEYSVEEKMKIFQKYNLAGVACWKRNLNTEPVWDVIRAAMQ